LLIILLSTAIAFGQTGTAASSNAVLLTVEGEVEHPLKLTAGDLARLPRRSVRAKTHDGKEASFDGVELSDVLKPAGVKFGEQLRGKDLALFLVVAAADGYRAVSLYRNSITRSPIASSFWRTGGWQTVAEKEGAAGASSS